MGPGLSAGAVDPVVIDFVAAERPDGEAGAPNGDAALPDDAAPPSGTRGMSAAAAGVTVGASSAGAARPGLTLFELARLEEARREAAAVQASLQAGVSSAAVGARRRRRQLVRALQLGAVGAVAVGAVAVYEPRVENVAPLSLAPRALPKPAIDANAGAAGASAGEVATSADAVPVNVPVRPAFGTSAGVYLRVALPGQVIEYPVAPRTAGARVTYEWIRAGDHSPAVAPAPLTGSVLVAPAQPGIYHLALASGPARRIVDDVALAVLVPFTEKLGGVVRGYRIGRYPFETFGGERPSGFIEVTPATARLQLSRHLRLEDFLTHDAQLQWPRYVAVSPALLDKVELVVDEIARVRGVSDPVRVAVDVHSGFRTPLHNGNVEGSAFNSRHQYGDAADVAIDADGDGRFTAFDSQWAGLAAEMVEKRHPDLVGGLGLYTRVASPYVHIDVRGRRARWWRR